MNKNKLLLVPAALVAMIGVASCGGATKQDGPEVDCSKDCVDGKDTQVIRMPDGFRNVAVTKYTAKDGSCYMVFVTSRGWIQDSASKDVTPLPSGITAIPCTSSAPAPTFK